MSNARPVVFRWLPQIADSAIALASLACVLFFLNSKELPDGLQQFLGLRITVKNILLLTIFLFLWNGAFHSARVYSLRPPQAFRACALRVVLATSVGGMIAYLLQLANSVTVFGLQATLGFWALATTLCLSYRIVGTLLKDLLAVRRLDRRYVLIVGTGGLAEQWARNLIAGHSGTDIIGFIDAESDHSISPAVRKRIIGTLDEMESILMNCVVDEVFIALPAESCFQQIQEAIRISERVGVGVTYHSVIFQHTVGRVEHEQVRDTPVLSVKHTGYEHLLIVKRVLDILASFVGLMLLSPVLVAVAIAIKLSSPGPVFFSQERYGRNKRRFKMYKFRTMVVNAEQLQQALESRNEASGPVFKIKHDPRVTPIGRFLRKTSLDELPQLYNVLAGDMSLVGPRPLPLRDVSRFSEPWLMRRFSVKPGLTCLWQVNGRSNTSFEKWIALDLEYIDQWSLKLDFLILAKTVPVVLRGTGAA